MSPPAKMPGWPVIMSGADDHGAVRLRTRYPDTLRRNPLSVSWPSASTTASAFERLEFAGRLRPALGVHLHPLDGEVGAVDLLDAWSAT